MLEAWAATETELVFAAGVSGAADLDAVARSVEAQVATIAGDFDGAACEVAATPESGGLVIEARCGDAAAKALEKRLRGLTLVAAGAAATLSLCRSTSRHAATATRREVWRTPKGGGAASIAEADWAPLQRAFDARARPPAGDKRAIWARALRDAARSYADRPWPSSRWHPEDPSGDGAKDDAEGTPALRRRRREPSFFAPPAPRRRGDSGDAAEAKAKVREAVADAKGGYERPARAVALAATRRDLLEVGTSWPLDQGAWESDDWRRRANAAAAPVPDPPGCGGAPVISVADAVRSLRILLRSAPDAGLVAAAAADARGAAASVASRRGERMVLEELARPARVRAARVDGSCAGDAADNARATRGAAATARVRWLALSRRAIAASWPVLTLADFAAAYAAAKGDGLARVRRSAGADREAPRPPRTPWDRRAAADADAAARAAAAPPPPPPPPPPDREGAALAAFRAAVGGGPDVLAARIPTAVRPFLRGRAAGLEDALWRETRSVFRATPRGAGGVLPWADVEADLWPRLWRAFGDRWRTPGPDPL